MQLRPETPIRDVALDIQETHNLSFRTLASFDETQIISLSVCEGLPYCRQYPLRDFHFVGVHSLAFRDKDCVACIILSKVPHTNISSGVDCMIKLVDRTVAGLAVCEWFPYIFFQLPEQVDTRASDVYDFRLHE